MHAIAILLLSLAQESVSAAPEAKDESGSRFIDPEDGWFDVSRFLEHPAGFLPVIVPITEPALGYGAVSYTHLTLPTILRV